MFRARSRQTVQAVLPEIQNVPADCVPLENVRPAMRMTRVVHPITNVRAQFARMESVAGAQHPDARAVRSVVWIRQTDRYVLPVQLVRAHCVRQTPLSVKTRTAMSIVMVELRVHHVLLAKLYVIT